jgi:hypothetical protein
VGALPEVWAGAEIDRRVVVVRGTAGFDSEVMESKPVDVLVYAGLTASISAAIGARTSAAGTVMSAIDLPEAVTNFRPDSDVDVLVEFEPDHVPGLDFVSIERELSGLLQGRRVEMVTPKFLSPRLRGPILASAEPLYVEA